METLIDWRGAAAFIFGVLFGWVLSIAPFTTEGSGFMTGIPRLILLLLYAPGAVLSLGVMMIVSGGCTILSVVCDGEMVLFRSVPFALAIFYGMVALMLRFFFRGGSVMGRRSDQ